MSKEKNITKKMAATTATATPATTATTAPAESKILNELRRDMVQLNEVGKAKLLVDFEEHTVKIDNLDIKVERASALHTILEEDAALKFEFQAEKDCRDKVAEFTEFFTKINRLDTLQCIQYFIVKYAAAGYYRETFLEVADKQFAPSFKIVSSTPQYFNAAANLLLKLQAYKLLNIEIKESDLVYIKDNYFTPEKNGGVKTTNTAVL
jgi:hypothetical protein